jgi:hypothetical protein
MERDPSPEQAEEEARIAEWLKIGNRNLWIKEAYDPPFTQSSFSKCETLEELEAGLLHGNWSLGVAFHYQDLCLIQQVDGGDEWLTIRYNHPFESISFELIAKRAGAEAVRELLERLLRATEEQCRRLEY